MILRPPLQSVLSPYLRGMNEVLGGPVTPPPPSLPRVYTFAGPEGELVRTHEPTLGQTNTTTPPVFIYKGNALFTSNAGTSASALFPTDLSFSVAQTQSVEVVVANPAAGKYVFLQVRSDGTPYTHAVSWYATPGFAQLFVRNASVTTTIAAAETYPAMAAGDRFKLAITGNVVTVSKNGAAPFLTYTITSTVPQGNRVGAGIGSLNDQTGNGIITSMSIDGTLA